ncbi:TetR family transcriptional regulator [Novosphingobium sp. MMS21-SN21R]|uniref:TetR/AcrR family transcriptional regulator n=1 Tax=Novosphingobium sp. MMS21-SN21R TaxID=2969298 RepID=UPI0028882734|nr:TetR family transcriptional regulator [Novosphingobium sp. MMS21-SN21R]MDT0509756.1 TetR family transcriptional regulator [Novosphingobium sp. MMS21-SN21R]
MRRKVEAPYPRGEETRARILDMAIELFGNLGFDSVSTRQIAAAAAVPQASLRYYFVNKQGLYIASLERVQKRIFHRMEAAFESAETLLADVQTDAVRLIDTFCALQAAMVDAMIADDAGTAALMVIRHDLPSAGGESALSGDETAILQMGTCFARMIMKISSSQLDEQSAARIAGLINGQLTNMYLRRNRLAQDGWDITPERLAWIKDMIALHTRAILNVHHAAHGKGPD